MKQILLLFGIQKLSYLWIGSILTLCQLVMPLPGCTDDIPDKTEYGTKGNLNSSNINQSLARCKKDKNSEQTIAIFTALLLFRLL